MPTVPVINGLTDLSHPCQMLADMLTVIEQRARLAGSQLGVARRRQQCLQFADRGGGADAFRAGGRPVPTGYEPDSVMCAAAAARGARHRLHSTIPREAVAGAEVVVTDTWVSMGQDDRRVSAGGVGAASRSTRR